MNSNRSDIRIILIFAFLSVFLIVPNAFAAPIQYVYTYQGPSFYDAGLGVTDCYGPDSFCNSQWMNDVFTANFDGSISVKIFTSALLPADISSQHLLNYGSLFITDGTGLGSGYVPKGKGGAASFSTNHAGQITAWDIEFSSSSALKNYYFDKYLATVSNSSGWYDISTRDIYLPYSGAGSYDAALAPFAPPGSWSVAPFMRDQGAPVPEPSTFLLFGIGLAGIRFVKGRFRK